MSDLYYRALIVDDDPISRNLTAHALNDEGFLCTEADDGQEALLRLKETFEVVVTDLLMPQLNGHALVVKLLEREPRPVIIALTGVLEPRLVSDLILRGIDDVCFKPVDFPTFAAKVRAYVQRRQRTVPRTNTGHVIEVDVSDLGTEEADCSV
jgi:DNA-binding response OmpR family regulator